MLLIALTLVLANPVHDILADIAIGQDASIVLATIDAPPHATAGNIDQLMTMAGADRVDRQGRASALVRDVSKLYPNVLEHDTWSVGTSLGESTLRFLEEIGASERARFLSGDPVDLARSPLESRLSLIDSVGGLGDLVPDAKAGLGTIRAVIHRHIQIFEKGGGVLHEFGLPASASEQSLAAYDLPELVTPSRVPSELRVLIGDSTLSLQRYETPETLGIVIKRLSEDLGTELQCDSRIAHLMLFSSFSADEFPAADFLWAVAASSGMYWRPVGELFFLSVWPGDPREMVRMVRRHNEARAAQFFASKLGPLGLGVGAFDENLILRPAQPFGAFSAREQQVLLSLISQSETLSDPSAWNNLENDRVALAAANVKCLIRVTLFIRAGSNEISSYFDLPRHMRH